MLVYKMNQLLLLAGLVLVLYIMNEKKMFSGVSKTLSSGKNNTMLVLLFCGVILFMCMQKGKVMEYFVVSDVCSGNEKKMHIYDPDSDAPHTPICIEKDSEFDKLGITMDDPENMEPSIEGDPEPTPTSPTPTTQPTPTTPPTPTPKPPTPPPPTPPPLTPQGPQ